LSFFSNISASWLAHRLTIGRDHTKVFKDSCVKFRVAFSEAKVRLSSGRSDAHAIMSKFCVQHDAAIIEFRHYVARWKRKRFDATCETFRQCREKIKPGIVQYYEATATGKVFDHSDIQKLRGAIDNLLTFADET
jgi:hypothetical protein